MPSHVARHYALALPAPPSTNAIRDVHAPLSPEATSSNRAASLLPAETSELIDVDAACLIGGTIHGEQSIASVRSPPTAQERAWPPASSVARSVELLPTSACEPIDVDAARFIGATIRLFDVEVLVVQVAPRVIGDRGEAPALVAAFQARFQRTIVLVARDRRGVPTFFGPGPIAMVLAKIPFEALTWQRFRYRPPRPMMLPIPIDPPPQDSASYEYGSVDASAYRSADNRPVGIPTRDLGRRTRTIPGSNASDRSAPGRAEAGHGG